MSEKVIAIMNKPANCQVCVFWSMQIFVTINNAPKGLLLSIKRAKSPNCRRF